MNWTIACNGTEKTLADWGLARPRRTLVSQGVDALTFRADGAAADATPLFSYKSIVTLWRDRQLDGGGNWSGGISWFQGLVTQIPRVGTPSSEQMEFQISGPWWYLENKVFQMAFQNVLLGFGLNQTPILGPASSSHLFLNLNPALTVGGTAGTVGKLTTGQQIIAALEWCLKPFTDGNVAPPFQIGSITPTVEVPIDEVRDITCAEVIHKMLRWTPDAVAYFDYTTLPPTFHVLRRQEMRSVNIQ